MNNRVPLSGVSVGIEAEWPPSKKVEAVLSGLQKVSKEVSWSGGTVNLDLNYHIGLLMILKEIAELVEALQGTTETVGDNGEVVNVDAS